MKKNSPIYECQSCGARLLKWSGKCPNCGSWESLVELSKIEIREINNTNIASDSKALPITEIKEDKLLRFSTKEPEFDLVLGGGIIEGSLILIGGTPGVGKSTLLLKIAGNLARDGKKVLYVSGEESANQIKMRATRIEALDKNLYLLPEIKLETIIFEAINKKFEIIIIDSIQTIYTEKIGSAPGSVSQVREVTFELMRLAKGDKITIFIIGHITKEGSIAGPRVLEHMVDTVLYFEGDGSKEIRFLRGFKNRFGTTSEIGIFEMTEKGLVSAKSFNSFVGSKKAQAGSVITVLMEGTRALVLEVQALVALNKYGAPKRSTTGYDLNRLNMLLALLERKIELPFNEYDVFVNITGGIKINETSADLAVIAAIISSFKNRPVAKETIFIGEVSLIGDIRSVQNLELRLKEAKTHGFEKAIVPKKPQNTHGIKCFEADEVVKILDWM